MWHIWGLTRSPEIPCEATCRIQALPFPARRTGRHAERHVPQEESGPHVAIIYYSSTIHGQGVERTGM